ncbi:MAG: HAMP domain-containing sensor histidine kinase [Caldilineaceae bacterium]
MNIRTQPIHPTLVLTLACVLALLLFLLDVALPQDHVWGIYLIPILVVFLWGRGHDVYIVAALVSMLVVAAYWTEEPSGAHDLLVNHLLPLLIIWGIAWLLDQRRQVQEQMMRRGQELDELVKARTAALAAREQELQALTASLEDRVAARTAELQSTLADAQYANHFKDEFMAMISLRVRTPLSGVLNLSQGLADHFAGPLNDRQAAYIQGIVSSGEQLLDIVNGMLSYIHVLSGKFDLRPAPCGLAGLLAICATSQQHKVQVKGQSIAVRVEPDDLVINGDATAIAEVLKRLLDNAVKFTPEGGQIGLEARLVQRARPVDDGGDASPPLGPVTGADPPVSVEFVVWDTGIGITAGQFDRILKPFVQSDASLARGHQGIGLGLAYVDQMVRVMGGTLAIESMPRVGSRFTVTLPARLPA